MDISEHCHTPQRISNHMAFCGAFWTIPLPLNLVNHVHKLTDGQSFMNSVLNINGSSSPTQSFHSNLRYLMMYLADSHYIICTYSYFPQGKAM